MEDANFNDSLNLIEKLFLKKKRSGVDLSFLDPTSAYKLLVNQGLVENLSKKDFNFFYKFT
jgi:hypothetical protein